MMKKEDLEKEILEVAIRVQHGKAPKEMLEALLRKLQPTGRVLEFKIRKKV